MATITIRNLDDDLKHQLRIRAAQHGRSMEGEVRDILTKAVRPVAAGADWVKSVRALFEPLGGVDLPEISREGGERPLPTFE